MDLDFEELSFRFTMVIIAFVIIAPIVYFYLSRELHKKFISLGVMDGKSLLEIQKVVGTPSTQESLEDGYAITWDSSHYAIVLKFNKELICVGKLGEVIKNK